MSQGLPDWPGSLAPARSEDNVVLRLARPLLVAAVKLFEALRLFRGKGTQVRSTALAMLLGGRNIGMDFRSDGGKIAAPNAHTGRKRRCLQRTIQYASQQTCIMT